MCINRFGNEQANTPLWAAAPMEAHTRAFYDAEPTGEWKDGWEITSQLFGRMQGAHGRDAGCRWRRS